MCGASAALRKLLGRMRADYSWRAVQFGSLPAFAQAWIEQAEAAVAALGKCSCQCGPHCPDVPDDADEHAADPDDVRF